MTSRLLLALASSYLVGSIPTAYLVVRWLKRVDVRTVGSGNVGATNVTRVAGRPAGVAVFLVDAIKGFVAARLIAPGLLPGATATLQMGCGLLAVIGHSAPVWLGFRGGKGVATTIGALLGAQPLVGGVYLLVWLVGFLCSRYVSIGSLIAALTIPLTEWLMHRPASEVALGSLFTLLILIRHRANIERLIQGREHRA